MARPRFKKTAAKKLLQENMKLCRLSFACRPSLQILSSPRGAKKDEEESSRLCQQMAPASCWGPPSSAHRVQESLIRRQGYILALLLPRGPHSSALSQLLLHSSHRKQPGVWTYKPILAHGFLGIFCITPHIAMYTKPGRYTLEEEAPPSFRSLQAPLSTTFP